jgi:hypothetical protein
MSWYYVGLDAAPVGPISLEDLQGRRSAGVIGPDTYVIEAPAGSAPKEWRRYRDVFATPAANLPPLPTAAAAPPATPTMGIPHPLFPSALPATPSPGGPVFTGAHPSTYHLPPRHNNAWCLWGFGLGLAGLPLLLCAGAGSLLAVAGLVASIVGLVQVGHHREQHGRGLAIAGVALSVFSLIIVLALGVAFMTKAFRSTVEATMEQTSNDSDTR